MLVACPALPGILSARVMVKLVPKHLRRPHIAADLTTASGRARAWRELYLGDHGFLRVRFSNLHQISDEMWRSNQPSPAQLRAHARLRGIRTILNLRGETTKGYYLLEREACAEAGLRLVDFKMLSREPPAIDAILAARELFETIEYPVLMHCKSGADRAGIMAVLYMHLRQKRPFREAFGQLSGRYLHIRQGRTGVLDAFCEAFLDWSRLRQPESDDAFMEWVTTEYDPAAVKAAFLARLGKGPKLDEILGRE